MTLEYQVVNDLSYDSIENMPIPNYKRQIFKVNNLIINKGNSKKQHVGGKAFLFSLNDWQYGHVMQECVGHYEFLKQYIPDLQIIFTYSGEAIDLDNLPQKVFIDLFNLYNGKKENIVLLKNAETSFESIYYFYNFFMFDLEKFLPTNKPIHSELDEDFNHQIECANLVRQKILPYLNQTKKEKIFITRKFSDQEYKKKMILQEKVQSGIASDSEFKEYEKYFKIAGEGITDYTIRTRLYNDAERIEKYFKDIKYKIIDNEGLGLFEQANIYHNATHIVSVDGTGCYNSIFADPDTKVTMINTNHNFYWFFDLLIKSVGVIDTKRIPERNYGKGEIYIIDIIKALDESYDRL